MWNNILRYIALDCYHGINWWLLVNVDSYTWSLSSVWSFGAGASKWSWNVLFTDGCIGGALANGSAASIADLFHICSYERRRPQNLWCCNRILWWLWLQSAVRWTAAAVWPSSDKAWSELWMEPASEQSHLFSVTLAVLRGNAWSAAVHLSNLCLWTTTSASGKVCQLGNVTTRSVCRVVCSEPTWAR